MGGGSSVTTASLQVLLLFLCFLLLVSAGGATLKNTCSSKERRALLSFKQGLTDPSNRLSSWSPDHHNDDCCQWTGVRCDNFTGAVTQLHLYSETGFTQLGGSISPSLIQLESLSYLDLSGNDGLRVDSLGWIAHLRALKYLDMSDIDLHGTEGDWLQVVSMLPSLSVLHLSNCKLESMIPTVPLGHDNFSSLQVLDLSYNRLSCRIPDWLFNLSNIRDLDLSENSLYGEIPESLTTLRMLNSLNLFDNSLSGSIPAGIGQLARLETLFLNSNKLNGSIPWSIGNSTSLRSLDLNDNKLSGTIPETLWLLSNLDTLVITSNPMLGGILSEANLAKLPKLISLSLSSPLISLRVVDPRWTPPFQLGYLDLSFSQIGPEFPSWFRSQTGLMFLYISKSGIEDTIPDWFWKFASGGIQYLNLAGNQIKGDLTHAWFNSKSIDISSNCFNGQLPQLSADVMALNVGNNTMSGPISTFTCAESNRNNQLEFLDISNNNLSGPLSGCWMHWQFLLHLNLGSNNLVGKIPASIGSLYYLQTLQLSQNRLSGDIPLSLKNCTSLGFINLGENELTGFIPNWIGELNNLVVLGLRSNKFTGSFPMQLCQLSYIMVLDLANNSFSGILPKCISNFSSMSGGSIDPLNEIYPFAYSGVSFMSFPETLELVTKGTKSAYKDILQFVMLIDFSNNKLSGSIPDDISRLAGLHFLNLSRNHLVGEIPKKLGNMTNLESLDLSRNQLSGEIPGSMSELSFLSHLDLSYNNLSGEIPLSTQLQSLNESSFVGNVGLCGAPLEKRCRNNTPQGPKTDAKGDAQEESEDVMFWFFMGIGPGFACAFCGVCTTLYFNTAWRKALFQSLEDVINQVYVFALVTVNRIKRRLKRSNGSVG